MCAQIEELTNMKQSVLTMEGENLESPDHKKKRIFLDAARKESSQRVKGSTSFIDISSVRKARCPNLHQNET